MNIVFVFQSTLFETANAAHRACAEEWLSAHGLNDRETILEALAESTDADLAAECNEAWGMDEPEPEGEGREDWFDVNRLEEAFADIREDPAETFGWEN